jgi:ankyrin repeat protein
MRLLRVRDNNNFSLVNCPADDIPPYAILSHTWGPTDEEVTYQDLLNGTGGQKNGYRKLLFCRNQADLDNLEYFWVDTCCIDKSSSAELSEAINSMFYWYQAAEVCYAYLDDVPFKNWFGQSRWFTRGWTLQELVAPSEVFFFDEEWNLLGNKKELQMQVSKCTRIPTSMLLGEKSLETFSIAQRMSWAAERKTSRIEDEAYCLMGIFDINMPLIYGERENAFIRLQEEIMKISDDHSLFAWQSTDNRGGCLAASVASFRNSSSIVQSNSSELSDNPPIVSSRGIHLDVRFMSSGPGRLGFAILNCCEQGSQDDFIAIHLRDLSLTMKHFERTRSEEFAQSQASQYLRYPIRRVCIQKKRIKWERGSGASGRSSNVHHLEYAPAGSSTELTAIESSESLFKAVQMGNEDDVWSLLTRRDIELNKEDGLKKTPLSYAAANGSEEIVRMLISQPEIHIDTRDMNQKTPLSWAVENGHEAVVKLLLGNGKVDVNAKDLDGRKLLSKAAENGYEAVVKLLIETGKVEVDPKDNNLRTPLWWAALKGHKAIVKLLLETGKVEVDSTDYDGMTPLWSAAREGHEAVVKLLLETGKVEVD